MSLNFIWELKRNCNFYCFIGPFNWNLFLLWENFWLGSCFDEQKWMSVKSDYRSMLIFKQHLLTHSIEFSMFLRIVHVGWEDSTFFPHLFWCVVQLVCESKVNSSCKVYFIVIFLIQQICFFIACQSSAQLSFDWHSSKNGIVKNASRQEPCFPGWLWYPSQHTSPYNVRLVTHSFPPINPHKICLLTHSSKFDVKNCHKKIAIVNVDVDVVDLILSRQKIDWTWLKDQISILQPHFWLWLKFRCGKGHSKLVLFRKSVCLCFKVARKILFCGKWLNL